MKKLIFKNSNNNNKSATDENNKNNVTQNKINDNINTNNNIIDTNNKNNISNNSNIQQKDLSTIKNLHNLYILFLSLSNKPNHQQEIIDYLKTPLLSNNSKNQIFIDLNFAHKILQSNPSALALVYCLMGRYNESIKIALENNQKEISIFIAQNIEDDKIKKDIWLRIFKFYKTNNFANAKSILESSNGVLKIEDILPFMMDNVKLEELKTDLQDCINFYEEGVTQLRQEINDYNKSTENIINDIYKIKKKSTYLNYTQVKCEKCQKDITGSKFFLFPCGHIFDTNCLVKILIEYDNKNIGDKKFRDRVNNIKQLSEKILRLRHKKTKIRQEQKLQSQSTFKVFFNFINKDNKEEFSKEEENELKATSNELFRILKEECVLCGQEMINSTQIKLGEDENKKWADLI